MSDPAGIATAAICVPDDGLIGGGSSSGSAVAVAAGLVTFALGTDTAGSDAQTRPSMQEFALTMWQRTGTTILMVTHDDDEALYLDLRDEIQDMLVTKVEVAA